MGVSNFPAQATPFVGRSGELVEIAARLRDPACRLLTLVGPGGIGKTRLALEVAQQVTFPDGVFFIPLQPLTSAEFIVTSISDVLHLSSYGNPDVRTQLLAYLQNKYLLLVLDNFEHLLDGTELLLEILEVAPNVNLLVTSRERLRLREEWVIDVHGLPFPQQADTAPAEEYSAVQLFAQSTRRIGSTLRAEDTPYVAQICQLVGGIPLAIELAAAWTRAISCQQIQQELERSLDILETSFRNPEPRHRTMRTTFEPTWQRLTKDEQDVFMRLSVFRGGFTWEAAEQVAGAALRTLSALVDKSLLWLGENGRYDLHELLRQYGEERLEASGLGGQVRDAHSAYYADFIHQREPDIKGRRQLEGLNEISADFENVRSAWNRACMGKNEAVVAQMIDGLWEFCEFHSRQQERQALFQSAEEQFRSGPNERLWGRLLARAATGESAQQPIETAHEIALRHHDDAEVAFCLIRLAFLAYASQKFDEAMAFARQSLVIYTQLQDRYAMANALYTLQSCSYKESWDDFSNYSREALRLRREIGDRIGVGLMLTVEAMDYARTGQFAEAERAWLERLEIGREYDVLSLVASSHGHIAHKVYFFVGDFAQARDHASEAIRTATSIHDMGGIGWGLVDLSLLANMDENYSESKRLCDQAMSLGGRGSAWISDLARWSLSMAACGMGDYGAAASFLSATLRFLSTIHGLVGIIGALPVAAIVLANRGDSVRAVELLALAFTHPVRADGWMRKWPLLMRLCADLERALGPTAFSAAWERGKLLDAEVVIAALQQGFQSDTQTAAKQLMPPLLEPLTNREMEILRLVADGLANQEIADRLFLSLGTVRWYTNQIYGKLGVKARTQAVRRAQELNLLI